MNTDRSNPLFSRRQETRLLVFLALTLLAGPLFFPELISAAEENLASGGLLTSQVRETASLFGAIMKVTGALAIVVGLMMLVIWLIKKAGLGQGSSQHGSLISILDTRMIAPKKYVAVLDIAGEFVVVGITDQNINLLSKLDKITLPEKPAEKTGAKTASFSGLLDRAAKHLKTR
ncbi:MAG: flagellar biosynthetic protein FliO [Proteobacteria bacterium]|nr:flagellar biosynthetic protein FliO [Pseudomonadota bacterium]MBU1716224.1 flagellar biosynthetic protein FliO [Pseudomonadota bacterium]